MDKGSKIVVLEEIIQEYNVQIKELQNERAAVESALRRHTRTNGQLEIESTTGSQVELIGPTEAVKRFFVSKPSKKWQATELRDRLEQMSADGKLDSDSTNFLTTVHWLLLRFKNDGNIKKYGDRNQASYKLKVIFPDMKP